MPDPRTTTKDLAPQPDPIFAAVAHYQAAHERFESVPEDEANSAFDDSSAAEEAMKRTIPTTLAGLLHLVEYTERRRLQDDYNAIDYFPAILTACRALLKGER